MKTSRTIPLATLLFGAGWSVAAQPFVVGWFTADGGDGTNRGAEFAFSGTTGNGQFHILSHAGSISAE